MIVHPGCHDSHGHTQIDLHARPQHISSLPRPEQICVHSQIAGIVAELALLQVASNRLADRVQKPIREIQRTLPPHIVITHEQIVLVGAAAGLENGIILQRRLTLFNMHLNAHIQHRVLQLLHYQTTLLFHNPPATSPVVIRHHTLVQASEAFAAGGPW